MKVELGAGERPAAGFLAVDCNPRTAAVVADAQHLPFADQSVEAMRAVDVLEHISYRRTHDALCEWARVCAPGAVLFVQVPDAGTIMEWYGSLNPRLRQIVDTDGRARETSSIKGAEWRLLGGHDDGKYADENEGDDWRWNAHYSLWEEHSLKASLLVAGFETTRLIRNDHPNLLATARRK